MLVATRNGNHRAAENVTATTFAIVQWFVRVAILKSHARTTAVNVARPTVMWLSVTRPVRSSTVPTLASVKNAHAKHHPDANADETLHPTTRFAKSKPELALLRDVSRYNAGCLKTLSTRTSWSNTACAMVGNDVHSTLNVAMAAVGNAGCAENALPNANHTLAIAYAKYL